MKFELNNIIWGDVARIHTVNTHIVYIYLFGETIMPCDVWIWWLDTQEDMIAWSQYELIFWFYSNKFPHFPSPRLAFLENFTMFFNSLKEKSIKIDCHHLVSCQLSNPITNISYLVNRHHGKDNKMSGGNSPVNGVYIKWHPHDYTNANCNDALCYCWYNL